MHTIPWRFYNHDTIQVARSLIGATLIHSEPDFEVKGDIVETEAYLGMVDPASHIFNGFTPRTKGTWGVPGSAYVFSIHGHACLNAITLSDFPYGCVLIRGVVVNLEIDALDGPGKVTKAFGIDLDHNGLDLSNNQSCLTIKYAKSSIDKSSIVRTTPRIGISKAKDMRLRFIDTRVPGYEVKE